MLGRGVPDGLQLGLDEDGFRMNSEGLGNKYLEMIWKIQQSLQTKQHSRAKELVANVPDFIIGVCGKLGTVNTIYETQKAMGTN